MNPRAISKLRQQLFSQKVDAFLITKGVNVSYLTHFLGTAQLLVSASKQFLIIDFRFIEQAHREAKSFQIWQCQNFRPLEESISRLVKKLKLKKLGFEAAALPYRFYHQLKHALEPVKLIPTTNIVEKLRTIKSPQEIKNLQKAASFAVQTLSFARKIIEPGKREGNIAAKLQYFMHKLGAADSAFDIIVASGKRSSLPHAPVSRKIIKENEVVLVDLGCRISGYNSDLTRMVFLGKISGKIKQLYEIVLRAQQQAVKIIKAGVKICQIDKVARQYITAEGFGVFFGHALGHGIGREVHEYPSISPENHDILKEGMVLTVEPAVYLPGVGGVRIEDMVLVTKTGSEVLTKGK